MPREIAEATQKAAEKYVNTLQEIKKGNINEDILKTLHNVLDDVAHKYIKE